MTDSYDVIIVGGGIHGVGVAQAAAARGNSVLLLEQKAIASGTSSRSSKLIHGGLRYLESAQFSLVRESLRERSLLLKLAPELVKLVPFHIPVYNTSRHRPWQLRAGLSLYALLGGLTRDRLFSTVPRQQWNDLDGLETRDLKMVFRYLDGQTIDDALLTQAVMRSAVSLGAELAAPACFIRAQLNNEEVIIDFVHDDKERTCRTKVLINAGGPWVNQILKNITPSPSMLQIDLVRGAHIVVPGECQQGIYYVESQKDGRAVLVMPRQGTILVGTTESVYCGDPAAVQPTEEDQNYLLEVLANYFPRYRPGNQQTVLSSFAGLRVLPKGSGKLFSRSRETIFKLDRENKPRLLSIYGGKLTGYRATAAKVVERLNASLPQHKRSVDTRELPLSPIN